jgi:hypothetical protein
MTRFFHAAAEEQQPMSVAAQVTNGNEMSGALGGVVMRQYQNNPG